MTEPVTIDVSEEVSHFEFTGYIAGLLGNARLVISLRRLNFRQADNRLLIPFDERTKIKTLKELQLLLEKFAISHKLSERLQSEFANYDRELRTFRQFSEKARLIRNNRFEEQPELVEEFDIFQRTVKKELVRPLYPLQLLSAFHMAFSQNACNFAVPGAGKTSIVYGAYSYLRSLPQESTKRVDKLLVIGPLSSFAPWEKEFQECFGRKCSSQRLSGDQSVPRALKEQHLYSGNPAELTLVSHGGVNILKNEIVAFLKNHKTMVVVDEAHRIKNPDGVWGRSAVEIAKEARARIVLTGTPVPNGYEDLYNLFQYLYPFKFKDILQFHLPNLEDMTKNCGPSDERVKEFTANISPYFIRIKKADLKLPPITETVIPIAMDPEQREIYDFIETKYVKAFQTNASASVKDFLNRARLIRLRQAATNPSLLLRPLAEAFDVEDDQSLPKARPDLPDEFQDDSLILSKIRNYALTRKPQKFVAIKNLFESQVLPVGGKVIVWSIFIQNAKQLSAYLHSNGIASRLLIGEVVQSDRETVIESFNDPSSSDFRVVIANPFAVAESISLHRGCHCAIYLERDYNCASFLQSKDRIHRYGLPPNQATEYHYLVSSDSIDQVIDQRLDDKIQRMEKIVDEDIPLFARIDDSDETDLIKALLIDYAKRA
jgi:SNF2 family DNA or RNA helicase